MLELITFFPHPPIVIPEVGGRESDKVKSTSKAMETLAQEIYEIKPDIIIAVTPHGHVFGDAITITEVDKIEGDLSDFGVPQVKLRYSIDKDLVGKIVRASKNEKVFCAGLDEEIMSDFKLSPKLDHGLLVPLYFINKGGWKGEIVPINIGLLSYEELYKFGAVLAATLDNFKKRAVLLISGDLSHRLTPDAPAGYSPKGVEFDQIIRKGIQAGKVEYIFDLDQDVIEEAGECGLRPIYIGMGALDGYDSITKEFSYEGPFGVGYLVASIERTTKSNDRELKDILLDKRKDLLKEKHGKESIIVRLARASIAYYLEKGLYLDIKKWLCDNKIYELDSMFLQKAGAFVSLKKDGQLRGCIGTIISEQDNLVEEVIHNAVSAAINDPRFDPLGLDELDWVNISVDVLSSPESITSIEDLEPKKYGVIVSKGYRKGLLLPDLAGIDTPDEQVRIAKQKAGIKSDEGVELERFQVERYI